MKTMVLISPIRFASDEAARLDIDDIMFVTKKRVPNWPSGSLNLRLKKYVTQDKGTRPEARESTANKRQSFKTTVRVCAEKAGQIDFLFISGRDGRGRLFGFCRSSSLSSSSDRSPSASTESIW